MESKPLRVMYAKTGQLVLSRPASQVIFGGRFGKRFRECEIVRIDTLSAPSL